MATKPLNKFTVQEARNLRVYENYSSNTISLTDADADADFAGEITGNISDMDGSAGAVTATCSGHGLTTGDVITISGSTTYNGTYTVTVANSSIFVFAHAGTTSDETGTFVSAANIEEGVDWISTGDGPAKKVIIFPLSGHTNDDIKLYLKINGTYGDAISLESNDYPITIDKFLIDQIRLSSGDATDDTDKFSVISFH